MTALRYPYVLAFEPMFVEIRNVETGSMAQVIQGNNLRCLYSDVPSSLQQAYSPQSGALDPPSVLASVPALAPEQPGQLPGLSHGRELGLEEIILASDDRVLTLRMA